MKLWEQEKSHIDELAGKMNADVTQLDTYRDEAKQLSLKRTASERLKGLSDAAAVAAIENTIDTINANAQSLLDQMFPDDGTVITLKNSMTTQAGLENAKMSVAIHHKGSDVKRIKSLSGGEKSRACLAFQLALSEMYQSPILLVDEGFTGLDDETKAACFEVLRSVSQNKLILVVEHGAPESFFDEVIDI